MYKKPHPATTKKVMGEIIYKEQWYLIMGACFEVYSQMGPGFLEPVYQECLCLELGARQIPYTAKQKLKAEYKNQILKSYFEPDIVCFDKIVLELKAVNELHEVHRAQLHNYLKLTSHKLGILINFCSHPKLQFERIAR
jgi:GxxExxY protein